MKLKLKSFDLIISLCVSFIWMVQAGFAVETREDLSESNQAIAIVLPESDADEEKASSTKDPTENIDDKDIFLLQDFEVSAEQDRGYYSANSLGGTRTNQLIKDTPMTISVINQELLSDMNLTEIDSLTDVVASAQTESATWSNRLVRFRGLLTRFQLFEFMPRQGPQNSYNIERVEVIRGANSLIYGQAAPGGKANYIGKKALFSNDFSKFEVEVGTNELFRAMLDSNLQVNDQWAVRLMATHQEKEFSQDYKSNHLDGFTAAVNFRPSTRTSFNLHAEYFDEVRLNPLGTFKDQTGPFGLTGILQGLPVTPDIVEYLSPASLQYMIDYNDGSLKSSNGYTPQLDINSADDLRNFYGAVTKNNSGTLNGPDQHQLREGFFFIGDVSHQFSENLSAKFAYAQENIEGENRMRRDTGNIYLSGAAKSLLQDPAQEPNKGNPSMPSPFLKPYWDLVHETDDTIAIRTTVSWKKEILGSKQQFLFGVDYDERSSTVESYREVWGDTVIDSDGTWPGRGIARDYVLLNDFAEGNWSGYNYDFVTHNSGNFNPDAITQGTDPSFLAPRLTRKGKVRTKALWVAAQGRYMNDRLHTLFGARIDDINLSNKTRNLQFGSSSEIEADFTEVSPSLGALFRLNQNLGIFVNYAESIESPTGWKLNPLGDTVPPELGRGIESGFKFEFLNGKISGQAIAFMIKKKNDSLSGLTDGQLARLYTINEYPNLYNTADEIKPYGRNVAGVETQSQGAELDLYYNPNKNLSFYLGYAYADAFYKDSPIDEPTGEKIVQEGQPVPGTALHSANLTTRYTFTDGKLKGWYLGSNIKYRSEAFYNRLFADVGSDGGVGVGNKDGVPDYVPIIDSTGKPVNGGNPVGYDLWLADNIETTAFLGWRGQFNKGRNNPKYNFQLSLANVFDARDLVVAGNNARYTDGRRISIKASIQF